MITTKIPSKDIEVFKKRTNFFYLIILAIFSLILFVYKILAIAIINAWRTFFAQNFQGKQSLTKSI